MALQGRAGAGGALSMVGQLCNIYAEYSAAGLWRGNATRILKVALVFIIMISSYKLRKELLAEDF